LQAPCPRAGRRSRSARPTATRSPSFTSGHTRLRAGRRLGRATSSVRSARATALDRPPTYISASGEPMSPTATSTRSAFFRLLLRPLKIQCLQIRCPIPPRTRAPESSTTHRRRLRRPSRSRRLPRSLRTPATRISRARYAASLCQRRNPLPWSAPRVGDGMRSMRSRRGHTFLGHTNPPRL
jgi:hypothetical protein